MIGSCWWPFARQDCNVVGVAKVASGAKAPLCHAPNAAVSDTACCMDCKTRRQAHLVRRLTGPAVGVVAESPAHRRTLGRRRLTHLARRRVALRRCDPGVLVLGGDTPPNGIDRTIYRQSIIRFGGSRGALRDAHRDELAEANRLPGPAQVWGFAAWCSWPRADTLTAAVLVALGCASPRSVH
jgi:hypothetical protein